jgi:hypothetical protein
MTAVDPDALAQAALALLDGVIAGIEEQRDQLVDAFANTIAEAKTRTCMAVDSNGAGCDRTPGHTGLCSFEFDDAVRRYRGFEEQAAKLASVEHELRGTKVELGAARRELARWRSANPNQ